MFEQTKYRRPGRDNTETIAITSTGRLNLSRAFVQQYDARSFKGAGLYWDEETTQIAIVLRKRRNQGSFPLVLAPNGQTAYIVADQFFRAYHLDPETHAGDYGFQTAPAQQLGIEGEQGEAFVVTIGPIGASR